MMKLPKYVIFSLLPGCCWPCESGPPDSYFEESYLAYRQPNRDRGYPAMNMLRDEDDGTYHEMPASMTRHNVEWEWGKRYRVRVRSSYNPVSQYTDRNITDVLSEKVDLEGEFRLYGISATYIQPDRRSFIDGKAFECTDEICAAVDKAIATDKKFDLVAKFGATVDAPIVVTAVESPTCYTVMDCTAREECCAIDGAQVCTTWEECPEPDRIGLDTRIR